MNWLIVSVIFTLSAVILVWPLWRHADAPLPAGIENDLDESGQDVSDERKRLLINLRSLRADHAEGKLAEADFLRLERECEQQLALLMDGSVPSPVQHPQGVSPPGTAAKLLVPARQQVVQPRPDLHRTGSVILILFVAIASLMLFNQFWKPSPQPRAVAAEHSDGAPDVAAMISRLEARLAAKPDDVDGQLMLARSYANLGRVQDAIKAWRKALELKPGENEALGGMIAMLLKGGDESSAHEALGLIAEMRRQEPEEAAWLWYQGLAYNRLGQTEKAKASLKTMLKMLPPESENAEMAREALRLPEQ
ncbi:MAG: tetratricopeptide repeat protein [Sulfuricellaceae bacterium]|nr:tetratricopeptide repeat protein [Sulfuricellaceae bacterium]